MVLTWESRDLAKLAVEFLVRSDGAGTQAARLELISRAQVWATIELVKETRLMNKDLKAMEGTVDLLRQDTPD